MKWIEFSEEKLSKTYEKVLVNLRITNTLWYMGEKLVYKYNMRFG